MVLQDALNCLPHGPQFRFLDRLMSLDPGKHGTGEYRVRGQEPFLQGHFPGNPLFPGDLLVEAAAQLAGVVAQNDPAIQPLKGLKLSALRGVKFFGTARPGETIRMEAWILARLGPLIQARVESFVGETLVMSAELTLAGEI